MIIGNPEEAHKVAPKECFLREDDIANNSLGTVSAHKAVMGTNGRIDDFTLAKLGETSYLRLQVEYVIEVGSSGLTNDERVCHRSTSSVDSGWRSGRAFREGVLRTLPDFDFKANEELCDGKVLRVGDSDAA